MRVEHAQIIWLFLGVLFLPLLSCVISFCTPARYAWAAPIAAVGTMFATVCCAGLLVFQDVVDIESAYVNLQFAWISVGQFQISIGFTDFYLPVATVSVVSFLVHLYSIGYMAAERDITRYFGWLGFFTFSMSGLVLVNNLLALFVFWEFVGVSSYFLIGFWKERTEPIVAANNAFLINRFGDVCLLIGILLLWSASKTLNIEDLSDRIHTLPETDVMVASLFVFVGVMSKSAQFPLFSWLPDAMEGPTPVSALIHAATMVAAGIFLVAKIHFIFPPETKQVMAVVGAITAAAGSLAALYSFNIKKILAWSTVSQLGLMVMALSTGDGFTALPHLFTHALFKAGLFLGAGAIVHSLEQAFVQNNIHTDALDIRNMGRLSGKMKVVFACTTLCAASLAGLPFTSGNFSKDFIMNGFQSWLVPVGFLISFITVLYSFRLIWYVFLAKPSTNDLTTVQLPQVPWVMQVPLILLALGSVWPFGGLDHLQENLTLILSAISIGGTALAFLYYRKHLLPTGPESNWLRTAFGLNGVLSEGIVRPALYASRLAGQADVRWIDRTLHGVIYAHVTFAHVVGWLDRHVVDGIVVGLANVFRSVGNVARSLANGKIQVYILWALAGMVIFMIRNLFSQN